MTKPTKWHVRPAKTDQPGHLPGLIRVFAIRMKKASVLSYSMSAHQDSDQTGWMSFFLFCHEVAHLSVAKNLTISCMSPFILKSEVLKV